MKKYRLINLLSWALCLSALLVSCDSDDEDTTPTTPDFVSIASASEESGGTITIPFRGANASFADNVDIKLGGTATEGEDYTLEGVTEEGIQISIINDDQYELKETIRVQMNSSGNSIHTVTIPCDGTDAGGWAVEDFGGDWDALEDYGASGTYGPYEVTLVQSDSNPNRFDFDNFYDSGYDVYMVFDLANGTVSFPDQNAGGDASNPGISASTGTFNLCEGTLTINLTYDGADWVYRFTQH